MVAWLASKPLKGKRVDDLFIEKEDSLKKVSLDAWFGPKVFNKGIVSFEKGT